MLNPYSNYMACMHPLHSLFSSLACSSLPCIYLFRNLLVRHTVSWRNGWLFLQSLNRVWANQNQKFYNAQSMGWVSSLNPTWPPQIKGCGLFLEERGGSIAWVKGKHHIVWIRGLVQGLAWPSPTWRFEYQHLHFTRLTLPIGFKEEIDEELITYQVTAHIKKAGTQLMMHVELHSTDPGVNHELRDSQCWVWVMWLHPQQHANFSNHSFLSLGELLLSHHLVKRALWSSSPHGLLWWLRWALFKKASRQEVGHLSLWTHPPKLALQSVAKLETQNRH